jgi:hypothetical protein
MSLKYTISVNAYTAILEMWMFLNFIFCPLECRNLHGKISKKVIMAKNHTVHVILFYYLYQFLDAIYVCCLWLFFPFVLLANLFFRTDTIFQNSKLFFTAHPKLMLMVERKLILSSQ